MSRHRIVAASLAWVSIVLLLALLPWGLRFGRTRHPRLPIATGVRSGMLKTQVARPRDEAPHAGDRPATRKRAACANAGHSRRNCSTRSTPPDPPPPRSSTDCYRRCSPCRTPERPPPGSGRWKPRAGAGPRASTWPGSACGLVERRRTVMSRPPRRTCNAWVPPARRPGCRPWRAPGRKETGRSCEGPRPRRARRLLRLPHRHRVPALAPAARTGTGTCRLPGRHRAARPGASRAGRRLPGHGGKRLGRGNGAVFVGGAVRLRWRPRSRSAGTPPGGLPGAAFAHCRCGHPARAEGGTAVAGRTDDRTGGECRAAGTISPAALADRTDARKRYVPGIHRACLERRRSRGVARRGGGARRLATAT